VRFERRTGGPTVLADLHQAAPCRCLLPASEDWSTAVFAATCGGLTGGDEVRFDFAVGAGAAARATTQAAERLYRARADDAPARIESRVVLGEGASAEWLPQETIVFDGARLKRRTVFELSEGADLLACELRVLGRAPTVRCSARGFSPTASSFGERALWCGSMRSASAIPPITPRKRKALSGAYRSQARTEIPDRRAAASGKVTIFSAPSPPPPASAASRPSLPCSMPPPMRKSA